MSTQPLRGNQRPPSYQALNQDVEAGRAAKDQPSIDSCTFATIVIILILTVFVLVMSVPIDVWGRSHRYWAGTHWEGLTVNGGCSAFRARKYTAELINVPFGDNPAVVCGQAELIIHGLTLLPTYCTIGGKGDRVWGTWIVDDEPSCGTWWDEVNDMGCTPQGSGKRRIEMKLFNYNSKIDDWSDMCRTTPLEYKGVHYDGPMSCENQGGQNVIGSWFIADHDCR
ncbi:hypothetical protein K443DRAFT_682652 [Laccaria amethystina LaAM-08-1]|uniref:Uncharacterized protein n=1 Tax=Laccaria amethystina LaAM-08-1 TaxID=1095629 RepID=A0A0C9WUM2_9AGAR|nr:hypothetical protein K443DRAFT_682652 [Laccaria amethystina LaAM-08-1]